MTTREGKKQSSFNFVQFEKDECADLVYLKQYRAIGAWKKNVYEFILVNSKTKIHLWESAVLRTLFYGLNYGSVLKLTYRGKGDSEGTKYQIHLWELDIVDMQNTITRKVEQKIKPKKLPPL